jgi:hypothetical protein
MTRAPVSFRRPDLEVEVGELVEAEGTHALGAAFYRDPLLLRRGLKDRSVRP